jgi:hypothetical protein
MVDVGTVLDLDEALKLLASDALRKLEKFREYARGIGEDELTKIWIASGNNPLKATELIYKRYTTEEGPDGQIAMSGERNWILDIMNKGVPDEPNSQ